MSKLNMNRAAFFVLGAVLGGWLFRMVGGVVGRVGK